MSRIFNEITPLSDKDCFYLIDRYKRDFDYSIHTHKEIELNFLVNGKGIRRIVGDSTEIADKFDLVIIGGNLEHAWLNGEKPVEEDMREITIQFSPDLLNSEFLEKNQMSTIRRMLARIGNGLAFEPEYIESIKDKVYAITGNQPGFIRFLRFLELLYELSTTDRCYELSSSAFSKSESYIDSRRIRMIEEYVAKNYMNEIYLRDIADLVGMSPASCSRFFKMQMGKTLSTYIIEVRIGHAARRLVDTSMTCAAICYECGFNNLANFNRLFKKFKKCTPQAFRESYLKTKILI